MEIYVKIKLRIPTRTRIRWHLHWHPPWDLQTPDPYTQKITPPTTPCVMTARSWICEPWPLHTPDDTSNDSLCDSPPPTTNPQNLQTLTDQLEVRTPIATAIWGKEHECQYESRSPNCFIRKCMVTFSKTPSTPGNPKPSPHSRVVAQTLLHNCSVEWFWFLHKASKMTTFRKTCYVAKCD